MNREEKNLKEQQGEENLQELSKEDSASTRPKYEKPRVKSYAPLDDLTFTTACGVPGATVLCT